MTTTPAGPPPSLQERVRAALARRPKRALRLGDEEHLRVAAAVLIPLLERDGQTHVVFTRRADTLRHHKGEISFPGGVRTEDDPDLLATALREAHEEIGLDPACVDVLGELDDLPTFVTGYLITPFVGAVPAGTRWLPRHDEVAEVLELPLRELLRVERMEEWTREGLRFPVYVYEVGSARVWGATARILQQLLEAIRPALAER